MLSYFETNQTDALTWANGAAGLRGFATIANRIADDPDKPLFPALQFSTDTDEADYTGDVAIGAYQTEFEMFIQNPVADDATTEAKVYTRAVNSMIRECPQASLLPDTGALDIVLISIETKFEKIKTNDLKNDFMQEVGIRATYRLSQADS